ncbi:cohesin domain-containing protein [Colwellia sp. E2M01]|uniref:cohesin domain-containing protein n=1 Tax=Colwellia sp. E2M01 TaxID=2841561 RepID=UPI001C0A1FA6|nr:cohesin domain-containing protein [Colwellia sp. E2M01]MBU2869505.1 cohesin domain-containing protein [Colwellia sp. E2M01]
MKNLMAIFTTKPVKSIKSVATGALLFLSFALSTTANANLITFTPDQASYGTGDSVLVDVMINNINPEAAEFGFDISFDDAALSFDEFTFDNSVLSSAIFADASQFMSGSITVFSTWLDAIDVPGSNFSLGQMRFSALTEQAVSFGVDDLYLADNNYNSVSAHGPVAVSAPNSALLILLACGFFSLRKKRNS